MRGVHPPDNSKEDCPRCRYYMVCGKKVCKVERLLRVLVFNGTQGPGKREQGDDGIDVETELGKGPACTCEDSNEAIHARNFVKEL